MAIESDAPGRSEQQHVRRLIAAGVRLSLAGSMSVLLYIAVAPDAGGAAGISHSP